MFARQIAVMKGQAWNVVETLKQPDHGPLELTRRVRVCVWDDLVDVPVAIPLRGPSIDMQMRKARNYYDDDDDEEMDISAAMSPPPGSNQDLLGLGSPSNELPNPNRFELSRSRQSGDLTRVDEGDISPISEAAHGSLDGMIDGRTLARSWETPTNGHAHPGHKGRSSHGHVKQSSVSHRRGSNGIIFSGDDLEGDLGYAAAEGMEGNQRKVIVERLEAVKSKNPVFTWC